MLAPGDHVLAAFSGGADSTALAIVLATLGYRVSLGHVDHGMRTDSALDAFHCRSTARRLGLSIEVMKVAVEPPTEAEARRVRYEALEQMRKRAGADRIATGHTLNDEAETVKMRLERGGFGLGIPPVRDKIVRPLLCVGRRSTEEVCLRAGVLFLEDPTNGDIRFTRNRIRRELAVGPEEAMANLVSIGARNRSRKDALDAMVSDSSNLLRIRPQPRLDRRGLLAAPRAVARGLVRRALEAAGVDASDRHVDDIVARVAPAPGSSLDLPGGMAIWHESSAPHGLNKDWLVIGRRPRREDVVLPESSLKVPGVTTLPEWGICVAVSMEPWAGNPGVAAGLGAKQGYEEVFDAAMLPPRLVVRQWRPGDRFHPLRREVPAETDPLRSNGGSKKLQDFFVDSKVPRSQRERVPLLAAGGKIVWVVGRRIDNRYKVTPATSNIARIRVVPVEGSR